jgi:hypothetical protein
MLACPEQPAALIVQEIHLAEFRPLHAFDSVEPGEPLIQECVLRIQELG